VLRMVKFANNLDKKPTEMYWKFLCSVRIKKKTVLPLCVYMKLRVPAYVSWHRTSTEIKERVGNICVLSSACGLVKYERQREVNFLL
jgi:hypothetical protein